MIPAKCTCPRLEDHCYMFRLLLRAIFSGHQCIIADIQSVNTQLLQIVYGKIQGHYKRNRHFQCCIETILLMI